jgi:hypothetical protein
MMISDDAILKNPLPPLTVTEILFVQKFLTKNRSHEARLRIESALTTGKDINLSTILYPMKRYVKQGFTLFVEKHITIQLLQQHNLAPLLTEDVVSLICKLFKRSPKKSYIELYFDVYCKGMTQTGSMVLRDNDLTQGNCSRACIAFDDIFSLLIANQLK